MRALREWAKWQAVAALKAFDLGAEAYISFITGRKVRVNRWVHHDGAVSITHVL